MKTKLSFSMLMCFLIIFFCSATCWAKLEKLSDAELAEVTGSGFIADKSNAMAAGFWSGLAQTRLNNATQQPLSLQLNTKAGISIWIDDVVIETSAYTTKYIDTDGFGDGQAAAIVVRHSPSVMTIKAIK